MPRKLSNALTPLEVKSAKPGRHADGGGLHLLVKDSGARSWVYRFMLRGKVAGHWPRRGWTERHFTFRLPAISRRLYRLKVKAGIDPLEERAARSL